MTEWIKHHGVLKGTFPFCSGLCRFCYGGLAGAACKGRAAGFSVAAGLCRCTEQTKHVSVEALFLSRCAIIPHKSRVQLTEKQLALRRPVNVFWNQRRFSVLTHELKVNHRDAKNATNKAENICAEAEKKRKK